MHHYLIVDDVPEDAQLLADMLIKTEECKISAAETIVQASELIARYSFSALFLDIEISKDMNGIILAEKLQKLCPDIPIIFYTGHIHYCEEIFTVSPAALLIKPPTEERIKSVLQILKKRNKTCRYLTLNIGKKSIRQIPLDEIAYIENIRRRLTVFGVDGNILAEIYGRKLSEVEQQLGKQFLLCHQSIIVNMQQITSMHRYTLVLRCGRELPISQLRFSIVRKTWGEYLGESL